MSAIGFDIGSENSCIAVVQSGGIEILDNEYGLRYTPSYVAFTDKNRQMGISARNKAVVNIENTVFGFKRLLGKLEDSDIANEQAYLPLEIRKLQSGEIGFKVNYLNSELIISVEQLTAMILTKLKTITEVKLGCPIRNCVISVPHFFGDAQRRAMLDAANIAGLNPLKIINEPTAIALCYGFFKTDLSEENPLNVIFVDFGHTALTVSVFAFTKNKANMIGSVWEHIGGRDFDEVLVRHFVEDFKDRYQFDATSSKKALMSLVRECEAIKKVMSSTSQEVNFQIECIMQDEDVFGKTKRDKFEKMSLDILKRIKCVFHRILEKTQLNIETLHSVEIVGGASRIPAVKKLVEEVFGKEPSSTLNQDEAVSRGCALQCALLSPSLKTRNFVIEERPSYVVKIMWKNCDCQVEELVVFSLSDIFPAFKLISLTMSKPFFIEALQVINNAEAVKIGTYRLGNVPQEVESSGIMRVKVKACMNLHGIFSIISAKMFRKKSGVEKNDEKEIKLENDLKTAEVVSEDGTHSDAIMQEGKSGFVLKLQELTVYENVSGLSADKLDKYINAEQHMISKDLENKEKADARNAVEEYMYSVRTYLNTDLEKYVEETVRKRLLEFLSETESWLFDNQNLELSEYSRRLYEIKGQVEPINRRYAEREETSSIIEEYSDNLKQAYNSINNYTSVAKCDYSKDVEKIHKIWDSSRYHLDQAINLLSNLPNYQDLPSSFTEDLRSSLSNFQKEYQSAFTSLQNKIGSATAAAHVTGDGSSSNMKTEQENRSKIEEEEEKMPVD